MSRPTVRRAIDELVYDGILTRHHGKGTFVAQKKIEENLRVFMSYDEKMNHIGKTAKLKTLSKKVIPCDEDIAQKLLIKKGELVIEYIRIRYLDDFPLAIRISYYSCEIFKELYYQENDTLLFPIIKKILNETYNTYPQKKKKYLSVVTAKEIEAYMLKIESKAPLILQDAILYTNQQMPYEYIKCISQSDKYIFYVERERALGWDDTH